MAAINGTLILFNVDVADGTPAELALTTSATLNIEMDLPDASTKGSAGGLNTYKGKSPGALT
jgi:hypothetical protein